MSPTVRHEASPALDVVHRRPIPISAMIYAYTLLAVALGAVVVLVASGSPLPAPGLLLVLAIPLALCMNRFLYFPNEIGVTADAAVIVAAMVAFGDDAVWVGPLVLALLVGPLDTKHWSERAFVRMAYNSGSTALVAGIALAVFVPLSRAWGSSFGATVAAAAVAAVPYVLAESGFLIVLVALLGERPRDAARHQLPLNTIAFPLALLGATAGYAALTIGFWIALVLLLPAPLAPELAFVTLPRRLRRAQRRSMATVWLVLATTLLVASVAVPNSTARDVVGLVAVACFVMAETRASRTALVLTVLVVAAVAAFPGALPIDVAVPVEAVLLATTLGAVTLLIGARRSNSTRGAWALPFVAIAACAARAWGMSGRFGPLLFTAVMFAAAACAAAFGPLPWASRLVGPRLARTHAPLRAITVGVGAIAIVGATFAVATAGTTRIACALAAVAALEVAVAGATAAVRMWRFAPRRRVVDLALLTAAGLLALVGGLPLMVDGTQLAIALVTTGATAAVTLVIVWALARSAAGRVP